MKKPKSSLYRLNPEFKMSFRMANIIPLHVMDILPGDKINYYNLESFTRFAPLIFPVMHRVDIRFYAFFVPNRLVWDNWEDFITGGPDGDLVPSMPFIRLKDFYRQGHSTSDITTLNRFAETGTLADYLDIPVNVFPREYNVLNPIFENKISSLRFRGYQLIWNEYFRDQNLQKEQYISKADGEEALLYNQFFEDQGLFELRKKCWAKDYFTSALPWLQRGPLTQMPVDVNVENAFLKDKTKPAGSQEVWELQFQADNDDTFGPSPRWSNPDGSPSALTNGATGSPGVYPINLSDFIEINFEGNQVGSFTVEDLRRTIKLQEWRERNARGGGRYNEQLLAHFGVRSSDARLQRPEFLGAMRCPVSISEVLQSSESSESGTPLGEMGGHAISAAGNNLFKNKYFEEHGNLFVLMCVLPRTAYFQGLPKEFQKFDKFDYYWPEFAHIGEQPIMLDELYYGKKLATGESDVFGYTPRYAEYQYIPDRIRGTFRTTLKAWHMARDLDSNVKLNSDFVKAQPTDRIFAVNYQDTEQLYGQFVSHISIIRKVLKGAAPSM